MMDVNKGRLALRAALDDAFNARELQLAALLDSGRWPGLPELLSGSGLEWLLLCKDIVEPDLYRILPYAVLLNGPDGLCERILSEYGRRNSVFVKIPKYAKDGRKVTLADFVDHFYAVPHVLLAPEPAPAWMRIYDPEILQDFWQLADDEQKHLLMSDLVRGFIVEDALDDTVRELERPASMPDAPFTGPRKSLLISVFQQDALSERHDIRFTARLKRHLLAKYLPEAAPAECERFFSGVDDSIRQAESFGLSQADQLTAYADLDAAQNWTLHRHKTAVGLMLDHGLEPSTRLALLLEYFDHHPDTVL